MCTVDPSRLERALHPGVFDLVFRSIWRRHMGEQPIGCEPILEWQLCLVNQAARRFLLGSIGLVFFLLSVCNCAMFNTSHHGRKRALVSQSNIVKRLCCSLMGTTRQGRWRKQHYGRLPNEITIHCGRESRQKRRVKHV